MSEPNEVNRCSLCGEPMPKGEEMFNYHGYSGPCPKPPLPKVTEPDREQAAFERGRQAQDLTAQQLQDIHSIINRWSTDVVDYENAVDDVNAYLFGGIEQPESRSLAQPAASAPKEESCATAPSATNSAAQPATGSISDTTTLNAPIWRREPRPSETKTPLFEAIWRVVKNWEIQTETGSWYSATGNDVCGIIDSIASAGSWEGQPSVSEWAMETMQLINKLTPDIKGKAFDPDWFLLRQRLENPPQPAELVRLVEELNDVIKSLWATPFERDTRILDIAKRMAALAAAGGTGR